MNTASRLHSVFKRSVAGTLAFSLTLAAIAGPASAQADQVAVGAGAGANAADLPLTEQELGEHRRLSREANKDLTGLLSEEMRGLGRWMTRRGQAGGPNEDFDMYLPGRDIAKRIRKQTRAEIQRDRATFQLANEYYGYQGAQRYMGAFIESGAPYSDNYQWNTQRWAGLMVPSLRKKLLNKAKADGILNIRFGVNLQDLDVRKPETASFVVDMCKELWMRGMSPTIAILFFPSLRQWEVLDEKGRIDALKSYLMNEKFPVESGAIAEFVLKQVKRAMDDFNRQNEARPAAARLPEARIAVNPANEAETLAGFNGQFWHGALAMWSQIRSMMIYVGSTIHIGAASIEIREAVFRAFGNKRILFVENPAMTTKDYPSHQGDLQMGVNKLILGHEDLMDADYDKLRRESVETLRARFEAAKARGVIDVVEAGILRFVESAVGSGEATAEAAKHDVINRYEKLKNRHLLYSKRTGMTAKTDTMLMLDYYQQSEFILPRPVPQIIRDLSANAGKALKQLMRVKTDQGFLNILRERSVQAEQATGQKIWGGWLKVNDVPFAELLAVEDSIVLDKLIGLRNEWTMNEEPKFVERRTRAGFVLKSLDETDEKRVDKLLNRLLENNAQLLRESLGVATDTELRSLLAREGGIVLDAAGAGAVESLRSILSRDQRSVFHKVFGMHRERRLGFLPPHYARQIHGDLRRGFADTFVDYINALGIRVGGIGEMGTPYYPWGALVIKQMVLELVRVSHEIGFFIVRVDCGPLVGIIGWMSGPLIGTIKTNGRRAADGIYTMVRTGRMQFDYVLSAWAGSKPFFSEAQEWLEHGVKRVQAKRAELEGARDQGRVAKAVAARAEVAKARVGVVRNCQGVFAR